jgi:hypothetical protein
MFENAGLTAREILLLTPRLRSSDLWSSRRGMDPSLKIQTVVKTATPPIRAKAR